MNSSAILKEKIENSIDGNSIANNVDIQVFDNHVILKGNVKSAIDKKEIEEMTKNTFGVSSINNEIAINY